MLNKLTRKERKQIKDYNDCIRPIDRIMVKNGHVYFMYMDSTHFEQSDFIAECILAEGGQR